MTYRSTMVVNIGYKNEIHLTYDISIIYTISFYNDDN